MAEQENGGLVAQLALTVASLAQQVASLTEKQARTEAALHALAQTLDDAEQGDLESHAPAKPAYLNGKPR